MLDEERDKLLDKDKNGKVTITEQFTIPEDETLKKIFENDKTFSKQEFTSWSSALVTCLFNAWSNNDLGTIKLYVSNNYFYLCREKGVKSNYSVSNVGNCPNCVAVLKPNLKVTCDYCGVSVNDGKYNWIIDNIEDINI